MIFWIFVFLTAVCGVRSECTARGRFPNDIVEDCRGYTTCIAASTSFYQYDLACPPNFIYNHFETQCNNATSYHCLPHYNCTGLGSFPSDSIDCSSYIVCIQGLSSLTARLVDCPEGNVFNPLTESCTSDYLCPSATTTNEPRTITTDHPTTVEETNDPNTRSVLQNGSIRVSTQYVLLLISIFRLLYYY